MLQPYLNPISEIFKNFDTNFFFLNENEFWQTAGYKMRSNIQSSSILIVKRLPIVNYLLRNSQKFLVSVVNV